MANLDWDEVKRSAPAFAEDTLYAATEVLSRRESKSRPGHGTVTLQTRGINRRAETVMSFSCTALVRKRGRGPAYDIKSVLRSDIIISSRQADPSRRLLRSFLRMRYPFDFKR